MGLLFSGCQSSGKPLDDLRLGADDRQQAYLGQVLPWSFSVPSSEKADKLVLKIVPTGDQGWSYNKVYTNTDLQKGGALKDSIVVPSDAKVGSYRFLLQLSAAGKIVREKETLLAIKVDSSAPYGSTLDVGLNSKGTDLHVETDLAVPRKIKSITLEIVGGDIARSFNFDSAIPKDAITYKFHEHINVQELPKGSFQVILTVIDSRGIQGQVTGSFKK